MLHTFEEVRTRTPADPNQAAPEAIMPQAAWEALLRDEVPGLRPPYTPQALRQWLQATHPQPWAIGPPTPPPHHHHTGKGKCTGKGRARDRKGHSGKGPQRGPKRRAGAHRDTAPEATQRGGRKLPKDKEGAGVGTEAQRKRTPRQAPRPTPRKGIPRHRDQRRPTPSEHRMTPGDAHPQHAPPQHESDAVRITPAHINQPTETTQGMEDKPTRGEWATPTKEAARNTAAQPTTAPSPPGDHPGHHKGHLTGTGRR